MPDVMIVEVRRVVSEAGFVDRTPLCITNISTPVPVSSLDGHNIVRYDITACATHYGRFAHEGHYVCVRREAPALWIRSDQGAEQVASAVAATNVTRQASVLLLVRRQHRGDDAAAAAEACA